ncbi:SRPBCC family protein [Arthrobacter sp. OV608]|uniref:SRPBCC family protein n=1 Tax=Arthrobacter sp. OV608 TaxID=1882768 RepID=UPI0008D36BAA|nr:SRPBCC family protein [Arthrobacter sp. OV608]SEQ69849.1 Polyketide cyclase / dehydrase and lipid transport [Arthrobacter sp. OV608]
MQSRLFDLKSTWHLPATTEQVWAIIADIDMSWPQWWPHCRFAAPITRRKTTSSSNEDILKATTAYLRFKAILGYSLTISIHPTDVVTPRKIDFDAGGDLQGSGRVTLIPEEQDQATRMDIEWRVRPTKRWMNLLTPIAGPAFTAAHALLMHQGERGLISALAKANRNSPVDPSTPL